MSGQVLRRKIKIVRQAAKGASTPVERAWRVGFARALRETAQVQAEFGPLSISRMSLTEVLELPPERALILTLDGPETGLGLVLIAPDVLAAVVEMMALGRCSPKGGEARKPTRTDAAMIAPIVESALRHLEDALQETSELVWTSDFHFASCLEDARPLSLLLEDIPYRVLQGTLSLADGARQGGVTLVLPAEGKGRRASPQTNAIPAELAGTFFTARLAAKIAMAEARIDAVLARVTLPIAEAMSLKPGMVLDLSHAALDQISFEGLDGRKVASGKLGQHRGMRALRLTQMPGQSEEDRSRRATSTADDWYKSGDAADKDTDFPPLAATGS